MLPFRIPNLGKRIVDPFRIKRIIAHRAGLKMPRGLGFLRNFKKAIYNKVYHFFTRKLF